MDAKEYHKNDIDITDQIDDHYWDDGAFINPDTGVLTMYNEGGHNNTTCDIHKLFKVIKNDPKLTHLLTELPENNKCSNCRFWTNEADPCEWWSGKYVDDWKGAKFCSKSDFEYNTYNVGSITASAVSKEGYIAGLMTKPDHSCSMFEPMERPATEPPSST